MSKEHYNLRKNSIPTNTNAQNLQPIPTKKHTAKKSISNVAVKNSPEKASPSPDAKPMPQPTDRQGWMQNRSAVGAPKLGAASAREHGSGASPAAATGATDAPIATPALAPLPLTVPEELDVMAERPDMLAEMRYFLLGGEASAGTVTLSSAKKTKLSAHGQGAARLCLCIASCLLVTNCFVLMVTGGVGKTTMAAAVVRDLVVRTAFTRIAWVSSVGVHDACPSSS